MPERLKFVPELIPLILNGQKTTTWRLHDDKNLSPKKIIDLVNAESNQQFASAIITKVKTKKLGKLTTKDKLGHEPFENDQQMYKTFTRYYQQPVNTDTVVKIVHFKLL